MFTSIPVSLVFYDSNFENNFMFVLEEELSQAGTLEKKLGLAPFLMAEDKQEGGCAGIADSGKSSFRDDNGGLESEVAKSL